MICNFKRSVGPLYMGGGRSSGRLCPVEVDQILFVQLSQTKIKGKRNNCGASAESDYCCFVLLAFLDNHKIAYKTTPLFQPQNQDKAISIFSGNLFTYKNFEYGILIQNHFLKILGLILRCFFFVLIFAPKL